MFKVKNIFLLVILTSASVWGSQRRLTIYETTYYRPKRYARGEKTPYTGIIYSLNKNGKLVNETYYVDGIQEGKDFGYYDDGKILREAIYKNGKVVGEEKYYHPNGKIKSTETYDANGKRAERNYFDSDGKRYLKTTYRKGKLVESFYYKKGKLDKNVKEFNDRIETIRYVNGKPQKPEIKKRKSKEQIDRENPGLYIYHGKYWAD